MNPTAGLKGYFPTAWWEALERLPDEMQRKVQEIRIYADGFLTVSTPQREWFLTADGYSSLRQSDGVFCSARQVEACFLRFCQGSLYAHEEELKQGFVPVAGGYRVGIAGEAVCGETGITAVRRIRSLCIRLPREHGGCSACVRPYLLNGKTPLSGILVGEPSCGKTSLLRDWARYLAGQGVRVAVVDERGELSGMGTLAGCHVLVGYPKAEGVLQAVRCLAPQVILFDELGTEREADAILSCCHAGVSVVTSLHGDSPQTVACRPLTPLLAKARAFSKWIFLAGRSRPGEVKQCLIPEVVGHEVAWTPADCNSRKRSGSVLFPSFVSAGDGVGADREAVGCFAGTNDLYGRPVGKTVSGFGR